MRQDFGMANDLVEPPLEAAASAVTTITDSSEESISQVDGSTDAAHALVADGSLDSHTGLWV